MRLIALILTVTMSGPAVASLACDWACAAKHQASAAAVGGCHEHGTPASLPGFAAGHRCHDLAASTASILTTAPQVELALLAIVEATSHDISERARDGAAVRPHDLTHAPPILPVLLRI